MLNHTFKRLEQPHIKMAGQGQCKIHAQVHAHATQYYMTLMLSVSIMFRPTTCELPAAGSPRRRSLVDVRMRAGLNNHGSVHPLGLDRAGELQGESSSHCISVMQLQYHVH